MEVGGREVQSPSKDSIEMILLTSFDLKENCDNFIFKEVCANSKHTHNICFNRGDGVWFCVAVNKRSTGQCSVRTVFIYRFNISCCQIHIKSAKSGLETDI